PLPCCFRSIRRRAKDAAWRRGISTTSVADPAAAVHGGEAVDRNFTRRTQKGPLPCGRGPFGLFSRSRDQQKLLLDLGNNAGTDGVAALADSEAHALFH